jgi:hypothetical protein
MIRDVLEELDPVLNILNTVKNTDLIKFIDLVDSTILNTSCILKNIPDVYSKYKENIDNIEIILNNIYERKLYKCIYSESYPTNENEISNNFLNKINLLINDYENKYNLIINKNKIIPVKIKIGLLGGNRSHPFDNLYFYDKNSISFILEKNKISHLISPFFQEIIFYLFYKN